MAVHILRDRVFEDSFRELHRRTAEEMKNRLYIVFDREEGQDAGNVVFLQWIHREAVVHVFLINVVALFYQFIDTVVEILISGELENSKNLDIE